jgi:hypothetical protein
VGDGHSGNRNRWGHRADWHRADWCPEDISPMQESDAQESARREFGRKLTHRTGRREPDCRDVVLASEVSNKTIPRLDKACFELVFRRKPLCAVRTGVIAVKKKRT